MSNSGKDAAQLRVLVRGPTARDDSMTVRELGRAEIVALACSDVAVLVRELESGAGALLIAEECLADRDAPALLESLAAQPPWSDLPLLVLARQGADSNAISDAMALGANVTVLERPMRVASLISAVRSALRGRRRQYQMRDLLDGLRESDQRKNEFLATLAHELRNPLAPIRSGVDILQRRPENPAPVLEVIERQVHHMVRLVDDLLELSRITQGKVELRMEDAELATIVDAALETSRPLIDRARHEFELDLPAQPVWLHADPVRLAQVLSNLLNNAARYTDPGGRIRLAARVQGEEVVIEVSDNGSGLSREALTGVFDMFSQANSRDIRAQHGLGIGLALVRAMVEMHGGSAVARSDGPGKGSEFEVRLPLASAIARRRAAPKIEPTGIPHRILVVDDNRDAADSLAILLRMVGAEVAVAYDGRGALRLLESFRPRIAVLDLGMPGMSGLDLARLIRDQRGIGDCVLIALTGWGQEADRRMTQAAGFSHHFTKPVDFAEIQEVLASI